MEIDVYQPRAQLYYIAKKEEEGIGRKNYFETITKNDAPGKWNQTNVIHIHTTENWEIGSQLENFLFFSFITPFHF